jgi:hypothetical protein
MSSRCEVSGEASPAEALPESYTIHWVARRKAQVVEAVRRGLLSFDEACSRYKLSVEEFREWRRAFTSDSVTGRRSTRPKRDQRAARRKLT